MERVSMKMLPGISAFIRKASGILIHMEPIIPCHMTKVVFPNPLK